MKLIRVFPRKTKASPDDRLAYFGPPDLFAEADEVHVSVSFTADKPRAEALAEQWQRIAPTKVGGVAYGDPGAGRRGAVQGGTGSRIRETARGKA